MKSLSLIQVIISLVGILSVIVVLFGMLASKRLDGWMALTSIYSI